MDPCRVLKHACDYAIETKSYAALVNILIMCRDQYPAILEVYAARLAFDIFKWDVRSPTNTSIIKSRKWSYLVTVIANRFDEIHRCQQCGRGDRAIMWSVRLRFFLRLPPRCCLDCATSPDATAPVVLHDSGVTGNGVTFSLAPCASTLVPVLMTRQALFDMVMTDTTGVYSAGLSLDELVDAHGALYKYAADNCDDTLYFYRDWIQEVLRYKGMGLRLRRTWVLDHAS